MISAMAHITITVDRTERDCLRTEAFLALAAIVDTLSTDDDPGEPLEIAREDALAVVALLECIGWEPDGVGYEWQITMPRDQLAAFLERRREVLTPESRGFQTMIEDDVDDPEVRAEWRRDWHERVRVVRDVTERAQEAS